MTRRLFPAAVILLAALLPWQPVPADTTILLDGSRDVANTVIQVKGNMVRLAPSTRSAYVLFDKNRNLAIYVDATQKTYTEIDQQSLDKYAGMVSAMRGQLQLLPPAQRALVEQRMGEMTGIPRNGLPDLDKLRTVARGARIIAGFHCQLHLVLNDRQAVGDVCLSTAAEAGIAPADFATLMAMMDFLRHVAGTAQELTGDLTESTRLLLSGLQGVPVAARDYQSRRQFTVAGVSRQPVSAGQFTGYRSYRKQALMEALAQGW
jgi:hypothetical protein